MSRPAIPCPRCPRVLRSAAGLEFHLRADHPAASAAGANREALRAAYRDRDRARKTEAERRARAALQRFYDAGCPCGRSGEEHARLQAEIDATGPA